MWLYKLALWLLLPEIALLWADRPQDGWVPFRPVHLSGQWHLLLPSFPPSGFPLYKTSRHCLGSRPRGFCMQSQSWCCYYYTAASGMLGQLGCQDAMFSSRAVFVPRVAGIQPMSVWYSTKDWWMVTGSSLNLFSLVFPLWGAGKKKKICLSHNTLAVIVNIWNKASDQVCP